MTGRTLLCTSVLVVGALLTGCEGSGEEPWSVVGTEGTVIHGPDGIRLMLPSGALDDPTRIRIRRAEVSQESFLPLGPIYIIEPDDVPLRRPAVLYVPFDLNAFWGQYTHSVQVWQRSTPAHTWNPLKTWHSTTSQESSSHLHAFGQVSLGTHLFECTPLCTGKECGPDGCGGDCAPGCASADLGCHLPEGTCACLPDCDGRQCGPDGCGGECGRGCASGLCNAEMGLCLDSCPDGRCDLGENPGLCPQDCPHTDKLDVLLVIDNSICMANEQEILSQSINVLTHRLAGLLGEPPDLHLGVTTTDLGTAPHEITYCDRPHGGALLTSYCALGAEGYIVDLKPSGCSATRDLTGRCQDHTCEIAHCAHAPGTQLVTGSDGCPRCRNFLQDLSSALSCIVNVGIPGCGFEQPLEAMRLALDDHPDNVGFLREDSLLAIAIVTDEDDCSAASPDLFGPESPELGPQIDFRCFHQGVTCDVNGLLERGPRHYCSPREDEGSLLHPIDRYVSFLRDLRSPGRLLFTTLAGPVGYGTVTVGDDEYGQPRLGLVCQANEQPALPGIRLHAVASKLNAPADLRWAFGRVCGHEYISFFDAMAARLALMLGE